MSETVKESVTQRKDFTKENYPGNALFIFSPQNAIRKGAQKVVANKNFDRASVFVIALNCLCLCFTDPLADSDSPTNQFLARADTAFNIVFTIEMVFKIIAMEFYFGKNAYLRDPWNWLDFLVVIVGWLSYAPGVDNVSVLRTFRVLRPLRTLTAFPGMRLIVQSMMNAVPNLCDVMLLAGFIFFHFWYHWGPIVQRNNGWPMFYCKPSKHRLDDNSPGSAFSRTQKLDSKRFGWVDKSRE